MTKSQFRATPDYRVVSTFETQDNVNALRDELQTAGFKDDGNAIGVHHGDTGKQFIDPDGSRHGFFARLYRAVQRLPSWEASMLEQVEDALNNNHYVVSVLTDGSPQQRLKVRDIMQKHTQQRIYYRGLYSMEILREATDVTGNQWSQQVVQIEPFAIDLAAAPDFLSKWQQEARQAREHQGLIQARLNQSVQEGSQFRFVNMARWASTAAFIGEGNQNLYRQVVEQVGYETDYQDHVYVINFMEIDPDEADTLAERWSEISSSVAQMDGFVWATLYRAVDPNAPYQFVNYAQWDSAEAHRLFAQQMAEPPAGVTIHSGLYRVALTSN